MLRVVLSLLCLSFLAISAAKVQGASINNQKCGVSTPFSGLYPDIEGGVNPKNYSPGQIVELDPRPMRSRGMSDSAIRSHIKSLQDSGIRVSMYMVGGHCDKGRDCDSLAGVGLGSTGSWNWDKSERRILDINHPKVMKRFAREIEEGFRLGFNFIRIDNLHNPAGSTHPRSVEQMRKIYEMAQLIEDRLQQEGVFKDSNLGRNRTTGFVAHNSLETWENMLGRGGIRPPTFLTSERTCQLFRQDSYEGDIRCKSGTLDPRDVKDVMAGSRLALKLKVPYTVVEFQKSHSLSDKASKSSYQLPASYPKALAQIPGISEVVVIPSESQYVGRAGNRPYSGNSSGGVLKGPGPQQWSDPTQACASNNLEGPQFAVDLPDSRLTQQRARGLQ